MIGQAMAEPFMASAATAINGGPAIHNTQTRNITKTPYGVFFIRNYSPKTSLTASR